MKTPAKQTTAERVQLDRFLEVFPDAPFGRIKKTTHPDFVISTSRGVIGIELTQLYTTGRNSNFQPREIEAFKEKIVSLAKDIYSGKNNVPLEVGVHFSGTEIVDAKATAMNLVSVVEKLASDNKAWCVVTHDEIDMPNEFAVIRIITRPSHTNCLWTASSTHWLPDLEKSLIQTAISKKNEKISQYQKSADELWLLLVINQGYLSSFFEVPDSMKTQTFISAFSKTILFFPY